jgi:hypothetical protein
MENRNPRLLHFIWIAFCFVSTFSYSEQVRCAEDFAYAVQSVKLNYAGYRDKVQTREGELDELTDSLKIVASKAEDFDTCTEILQRWLGFCRDRHLYLHTTRPQAACLLEKP